MKEKWSAQKQQCCCLVCSLRGNAAGNLAYLGALLVSRFLFVVRTVSIFVVLIHCFSCLLTFCLSKVSTCRLSSSSSSSSCFIITACCFQCRFLIDNRLYPIPNVSLFSLMLSESSGNDCLNKIFSSINYITCNILLPSLHLPFDCFISFRGF